MRTLAVLPVALRQTGVMSRAGKVDLRLIPQSVDSPQNETPDLLSKSTFSTDNVHPHPAKLGSKAVLPAETLLANKSAHSIAGNRYDRIIGLTEKGSCNQFASCLMLIAEQQTKASALACHAILDFGRTLLDSDPVCLTDSDSVGAAGALPLLSPRYLSEGKFPKEERVMDGSHRSSCS